MEGVAAVLVWVAFGVACALIAESRGRSPLAWFLLGAFLQCLALIILLVLPDLKQQQAQFSSLHHENRRLREQMRLDRHVADQRHEQTVGRLAAHDHALGIDTAPRRQELASAPKPPPIPPPLWEEEGGGFSASVWYYAGDGGQQGPIHFEVLQDLWREGRVQRQTYVWADGMKEWSTVQGVPGLVEALNA